MENLSNFTERMKNQTLYSTLISNIATEDTIFKDPSISDITTLVSTRTTSTPTETTTLTGNMPDISYQFISFGEIFNFVYLILWIILILTIILYFICKTFKKSCKINFLKDRCHIIKSILMILYFLSYLAFCIFFFLKYNTEVPSEQQINHIYIIFISYGSMLIINTLVIFIFLIYIVGIKKKLKLFKIKCFKNNFISKYLGISLYILLLIIEFLSGIILVGYLEILNITSHYDFILYLFVGFVNLLNYILISKITTFFKMSVGYRHPMSIIDNRYIYQSDLSTISNNNRSLDEEAYRMNNISFI